MRLTPSYCSVGNRHPNGCDTAAAPVYTPSSANRATTSSYSFSSARKSATAHHLAKVAREHVGNHRCHRGRNSRARRQHAAHDSTTCTATVVPRFRPDEPHIDPRPNRGAMHGSGSVSQRRAPVLRGSPRVPVWGRTPFNGAFDLGAYGLGHVGRSALGERTQSTDRSDHTIELGGARGLHVDDP